MEHNILGKEKVNNPLFKVFITLALIVISFGSFAQAAEKFKISYSSPVMVPIGEKIQQIYKNIGVDTELVLIPNLRVLQMLKDGDLDADIGRP